MYNLVLNICLKQEKKDGTKNKRKNGKVLKMFNNQRKNHKMNFKL